MAAKKSTTAKAPVEFVGHHFHIFEDRTVTRQGYIRAKVEPGVYLVQFYEWFMGEPNTCHLYKVEDMAAWQFYEDAEHMNYWYEKHKWAHPKDEGAAADVLA